MHETVGDRAALKDPASHVLLVFALEGRWMVQYTNGLWYSHNMTSYCGSLPEAIHSMELVHNRQVRVTYLPTRNDLVSVPYAVMSVDRRPESLINLNIYTLQVGTYTNLRNIV